VDTLSTLRKAVAALLSTSLLCHEFNLILENQPPPGHFVLLYFATAASYTKKQSEVIAAPLPVDKLFGTLEQRYPGMTSKVLNTCAVTVNLEYVDVPTNESGDSTGKTVIHEGDEVAIIPPVSAG
jgi:molybdopterin converting factor small subunit